MTMGAAKISVVIPTYNRATLLLEAIESVRRQTRPVEEIMVVDDGSKDETERIMSIPSPGIRYIRQPNGGPAVARNTGLKNVTGDFVALLDSDDLWVPDRLERQLALFAQDPSLGVAFGLESKFTAGQESTEGWEIRDPAVREALANSQGALPDAFGLLLRENYIPTSSILVRRELLAKTGLMDPSVQPAEDYDLWFRLALNGGRFAFMHGVACHRRFQGDNLVNQWTRLAIAGAKVLARYCDHAPAHRAMARRRLELIHYDIGSRLFADKKYAEAWPYLSTSRAEGKAVFARPAKLALTWLLAGRSVPTATPGT
jgi:glycosyltransferase involved in cell wall biosynthesis